MGNKPHRSQPIFSISRKPHRPEGETGAARSRCHTRAPRCLLVYMNSLIDVFKAEVPEPKAERLVELREVALPELRRRCPGLLRAELVRLDATTWLDLLEWRDAQAAEEASAYFGAIAELVEMHELIGEPERHERGEIVHCA